MLSKLIQLILSKKYSLKGLPHFQIFKLPNFQIAKLKK
jgi:hypothetical protein